MAKRKIENNTEFENSKMEIDNSPIDYDTTIKDYPLELCEPSLLIAQAHREIKKLEEKMQKAKEIILAYMQENNIHKMQSVNGWVTFVAVPEKKTKRFDVKKAMEECPGLEVYYKESTTKGYLKIN
ncbi:MAG: hypothetical protein Q4Q06_05030 [Bacteroidota bacterium]|nr:hypothetical protein [Bacteroidota bacterium]